MHSIRRGGGRTAAITLALALVATGCASHAKLLGDGPITTTTTSPKPEARPGGGWIRPDLKPLTQPVAVGDEIVLYVAGTPNLDLVALDAASGRTRWSHPAGASDIAPGEPPSIGIAGSKVVYLEAVDATDEARLTVVDAASGARVWQGRPGYFDGWPGPCFDDEHAVCAVGGFEGGPQRQIMRFDLATGEMTASVVVPGGQGGRDVGAGLYDTGNRDQDELAAVDRRGLAWQMTLATLFPGGAYSTDGGWNFDRIERWGLFVGWVGARSTDDPGATRDLAEGATAAFTIDGGHPAWHDSGSEYWCNLLPCPGAGNPSSNTPSEPIAGVRLRATGTITFDPETEEPTLSADADLRFEGFDLRTGSTTWTYDDGRDTALVKDLTLAIAGDHSVVFGGHGSDPVVLDLATGATTPATDATATWCKRPTDYQVTPGYVPASGKTITDYSGQDAIVACSLAGAPIDAPTKVPSWVGPKVGGLVAWSEPHRVVAAPPAG